MKEKNKSAEEVSYRLSAKPYQKKYYDGLALAENKYSFPEETLEWEVNTAVLRNLKGID